MLIYKIGYSSVSLRYYHLIYTLRKARGIFTLHTSHFRLHVEIFGILSIGESWIIQWR